jgi:pimeloyl-ACP methyl ester carboxylesterase
MNYAEGGGDGATVVLLHGLTLEWSRWNEVIELLPPRAHLYAPDLRGHGRSEWSRSGYQIPDYVDDIAEFVKKVSAGGSVVIGHSLGALVALGVAARVPDLVDAVVAIDPPLILRDSGFESIAYSDAHDYGQWVDDVLGGRLGDSEAKARFFEMNPGTTLADAEQAMAAFAPLDPRTIGQFVSGRLFEGLALEDTLDAIACPALLLAGEFRLGSLVRDEDLDLFRSHTARGRAIRVPDCPHGMIWGDSAAPVTAEMLRWLSTLPPCRAATGVSWPHHDGRARSGWVWFVTGSGRTHLFAICRTGTSWFERPGPWCPALCR